MIFGILFTLAFLLGFVAHWLTGRWWLAILVPTICYLLNVLSDPQVNWANSFIFGFPIVMVGGLLGAYVIEIRRIESDPESETSETVDEKAKSD